MPWQLLMLFQNILAASFALVSRSIATRIKNAHFQVVAVIFSVIFVSGWVYGLLSGGIDFYYLDKHILLFILAGLSFGLTNVASYKVMEYLDAGVATIFSMLNTVAAVLFSTLLIDEGLTFKQVIGTVVLFSAIYLVLVLKVNKNIKNRWLLGLAVSLFAALCFGIATTIEKYLLNQMPTSTYIPLGWSFQWLAAFMCSILFNFSMWPKLIKSTIFKKVVTAGFIRASAGFLFIISLTIAGNLSVISVLSGVKTIFVVILAGIFLKERTYFPRKFESAVIATVGIAILLW